jgi:hypothetical protein
MSLRGKSGKAAKKAAASGTGHNADPRAQAVLRSLADLRDFIGGISLPQHRQRRLGYAEAIGWLVTNRPAGSVAARSAVLRAPRPRGGIEITLVYLDASGAVISDKDERPFARKFIVDELDEELDDAFGGTSLLIVS